MSQYCSQLKLFREGLSVDMKGKTFVLFYCLCLFKIKIFKFWLHLLIVEDRICWCMLDKGGEIVSLLDIRWQHLKIYKRLWEKEICVLKKWTSSQLKKNGPRCFSLKSVQFNCYWLWQCHNVAPLKNGCCNFTWLWLPMLLEQIKNCHILVLCLFLQTISLSFFISSLHCIHASQGLAVEG